MALGLLYLPEELWCALPHRPTSSGRWDVGLRGEDLAEEGPRHLVRADPGH
jgi:hypothetical protein